MLCRIQSMHIPVRTRTLSRRLSVKDDLLSNVHLFYRLHLDGDWAAQLTEQDTITTNYFMISFICISNTAFKVLILLSINKWHNCQERLQTLILFFLSELVICMPHYCCYWLLVTMPSLGFSQYNPFIVWLWHRKLLSFFQQIHMMNLKERYATLIIDEIQLTSSLVYDTSRGPILERPTFPLADKSFPDDCFDTHGFLVFILGVFLVIGNRQ